MDRQMSPHHNPYCFFRKNIFYFILHILFFLFISSIAHADDGLIWEKSIDCSRYAISFSALENSQGDYIIVGVNNYNMLFLKYAANGDLLIKKEITLGGYSCATDIIEINNNRYLITGYTKSTGILVCINDNAELLWEKKYKSSSLLKIIDDHDEYLVIGT